MQQFHLLNKTLRSIFTKLTHRACNSPGFFCTQIGFADTQSFGRIGAATTLPLVATPQLDSVEGSSYSLDASEPFCDCVQDISQFPTGIYFVVTRVALRIARQRVPRSIAASTQPRFFASSNARMIPAISFA